MEIDAVLLDIDGVLAVGDRPVPEAAEVVDWLRERGIPFRCVTNTTRRSRRSVAARLAALGLSIPVEWCFTPALAAVQRLREDGIGTCHLVAAGDVGQDFEEAGIRLVTDDAPCVVVGDAGDRWTYDVLNRAFRMVLDGAGLIALERDRYWRDADGLVLAAGPFVAALEYAAGVPAEVVGKPSSTFFLRAVTDLGVRAGRVVMVGDGLETDIGGARDAGLRGVLVRTGKFREDTLAAGRVRPDRVLDSVAGLPALLERGT